MPVSTSVSPRRSVDGEARQRGGQRRAVALVDEERRADGEPAVQAERGRAIRRAELPAGKDAVHDLERRRDPFDRAQHGLDVVARRAAARAA